MSNGNSKNVYEMLRNRDYPEIFCRAIASEMSTEFTSQRMTRYLYRAGRPSMEEIADEMFAIISDRDRIVQKKILEHSQASINDMYRNGLE